MRDVQAAGGTTLNTRDTGPDAAASAAAAESTQPAPVPSAADPTPATAQVRDEPANAPTAAAADAEESTRAGRRAVPWLAITAVLVLLADVATKTAAVRALTDHPPIRPLGGALYLTLVRNHGAAFSLAEGYTVVLTAVAVGVIAVIVRFARRLRSRPWAVALGLILGGAAGNLVDRIFRQPAPFRGAVVDFISLFDPAGRVWPIFNVADSALCVGVVLAIVLELTGRRIDAAGAARS